MLGIDVLLESGDASQKFFYRHTLTLRDVGPNPLHCLGRQPIERAHRHFQMFLG
jgi:hypothetical protein